MSDDAPAEGKSSEPANLDAPVAPPPGNESVPAPPASPTTPPVEATAAPAEATAAPPPEAPAAPPPEAPAAPAEAMVAHSPAAPAQAPAPAAEATPAVAPAVEAAPIALAVAAAQEAVEVAPSGRPTPVVDAMADAPISVELVPPSGQVELEVIELEAGRAGPPSHPPGYYRRPQSTPPEPAQPAPLSMRADLPPRKWPPEVMGDIMSRALIAVEETEPLGDVEGGMKRFRFHHLLVVSGGKKLVGLITRSDFLHAMLGTTPGGKPLETKVDEKTLAGAIMRKKLITAKMDTPIVTACRVLLNEKIGCLPVVLDDATVVGIVTESDFARLAMELLERSKQ